MSLAGLHVLPLLLLSTPPIPPSPPVMFRGDPAHTGVSAGALFSGQGGYRPDHPGSGYVQLWGFGATAERLPMIQAAAEYGLLRR